MYHIKYSILIEQFLIFSETNCFRLLLILHFLLYYIRNVIYIITNIKKGYTVKSLVIRVRFNQNSVLFETL